MSNHRVVITGIGALTPIGHGREGLWDGLHRSGSAVQHINRFDPTGYRSQNAAQINDFDPLTYMDERRSHRLDRFAQFALAACRLAIADAGIELNRAEAELAGIYLGSALGGIIYAEDQHTNYMREGMHAVSPTLAVAVFGGASSSNVALEYGWHGPNVANANGCASGAIAIGEAARLIRSGQTPVMLAGGVEAPIAPLTYGAFSIIKVMSSRNNDPATASRPFDRGRDGFVMAEGAGVLALEDYDHARARGAHIYAEVLGYGTTTDAYSMTAPLPSGEQAARAITIALQDAGLEAATIGYINAHGSSTTLNDVTEAKAIHLALGTAAERIPVSGTKGLHGHALGATGAIEAGICALAIQRGWLPPTCNLQTLDPDVDLDIIRGEGREQQVQYVLSNSFGFGGINASLVFGRV